MGSSITVNQDNFAQEVLEKSYQTPVLVDFFATWCGPCQLLKPMLEKLTQEYDFVLAKVDIDQNPELAQTYDVQGVPDVRIAIDGEVNEGFVGVLSEPQLRQLMAELNLKSTLEIMLTKVYDEAAIGHLESAQHELEAALQKYPENRSLLLEAASFFIDANQLERAETLLSTIQEHEKDYIKQAKSLTSLVHFKRIATQLEVENELDQYFRDAAVLVLQEDYKPALEQLLEIVSRDRAYRKDAARKAMLDIFNLLGNDHPLTVEYRKQLMLVLY